MFRWLVQRAFFRVQRSGWSVMPSRVGRCQRCGAQPGHRRLLCLGICGGREVGPGCRAGCCGIEIGGRTGYCTDCWQSVASPMTAWGRSTEMRRMRDVFCDCGLCARRWVQDGWYCGVHRAQLSSGAVVLLGGESRCRLARAIGVAAGYIGRCGSMLYVSRTVGVMVARGGHVLRRACAETGFILPIMGSSGESGFGRTALYTVPVMPPEYYSELADVLRGRRGIVLGVDGSVLCDRQRYVYHLALGVVLEITAFGGVLGPGVCHYYEFYSGWVAAAVPMRCASGHIAFSCDVIAVCGRAACPTMRRLVHLQRLCVARRRGWAGGLRG